jgi:maltokinase
MTDAHEMLASGDVRGLDEDQLAAFISDRRWYGARQQVVAGASVVACVPISSDPLLAITLVEVRFHGGTHELYHLMLGVRPANGPGETTVWALGDNDIYEAFDAPEGSQALLANMRGSVTFGDESIIEFRSAVGADEFDPLPASPRAAGPDQSNTSIVFDDRMILKCYRRLEPGVNPEIEVLRFLDARDFAHTPALLGWFEHRGAPLDATLGMVQTFQAGAQDGWEFVTTALREGRGDAALPAIHQLGAATGELHAALASDHGDPAFAPEEVRPEGLALMAASLDEVATEVFANLPDDPALAQVAHRADDLRDRLQGVSKSTGLGRKIRVHGDLHLGQALWDGTVWKLIDFEGEPTRPVNERRRKRSPLRDVAGLVRSLDYAVSSARLHAKVHVPDDWLGVARAALLDGYLPVVEPTGLLPPMATTVEEMLGLYELEKAVYELRYELSHRPSWVAIPAHAIDRLLTPPG